MFKKILIAALTIFTFNAHVVPNKLDTSPKFERAFVSLTPEAHVACYEIAPELNGMSVMFIAQLRNLMAERVNEAMEKMK